MKTTLKIFLGCCLVAGLFFGFGSEEAEAKKPILETPTCSWLGDLPDSNDTFLGECEHPCGGTCDAWISDTGVEFHDTASCDFF